MRDSSYVKIGAFVLLGAVLALALCVVLGAGAFGRKAILMETFVEGTVQGVGAGSPVKYRGIPIGTVRSVGFAWAVYHDRVPDTEEGRRASRYARIVFAIEDELLANADFAGDELRRQVENGMRVSIKSQGITGVMYLDLDYAKDPPEPLPVPWETEHMLVPSVPSFSETMTDALENVAREIGKLGEVADDTRALLSEINAMVEDGRMPLLGTLSNAEKSSRMLVETLDRIRDDPSLLLRPPKGD